MSASNVLTGACGVALGIVGLLMLPRIWHGWYQGEVILHGTRRTRGEAIFFWWPFGESSRRGAIRGVVAIIAAWWGALLAIAANEISLRTNGDASHGARIAALFLVACTILCFVLHLTVIFFNWPKFIVPPPQRNERGFLASHRKH
jgi:hypothetical protein